MDKKYRVLHIFSGFGGGISSLILNLTVNKSDDMVFDTLAFSYKGGEAFVEKMENLGARCYLMPRPRMEGYGRFSKVVSAVFSENKYDAIHCHISGFRAIPFKRAAKANGIKPFIIHAHTGKYDSKADRLLHSVNMRINYSVATDYFTCSDIAARYIFGEKFLKKRTAVLIPNGIEKKKFEKRLSPDEKKRRKESFGIGETQKTIVHIGRFSLPKNHEFLLEMMQEFKAQKKDYMLLLVGDGERFDCIKAKAAEKGVKASVVFCGRRSDVSDMMQLADCAVLPSENEGLPTVAVEAQAAGVPILLSDTITRQCDMGLGLAEFLPIKDARDWVRAVEETVSRCGTTSQDIQENLKKIERKGFTAAASGKYYCDFLKRIIERMREQA